MTNRPNDPYPPRTSSPPRAPPVPPVPPAPATAPPSILAKVGILAGGLVALALFAVWPMYQVSQREASVSISFKGILLGAMLTVLGLNLVFLGDKGLPLKKPKEQPLTGVQKGVLAVTLLAGLGLTALVWLYFKSQGYTVKF